MWKVPEGKVLLLGDGNFSFARSYSDLLNPTKTFITGYDSAEEFDGKYKSEGADNVEFLKQRGKAARLFPIRRKFHEFISLPGFTVLHEVDATDIRKTPQLSQLSFDLIIFNFPHPGGKTNLKKCRYLLKNTFIRCKS